MLRIGLALVTFAITLVVAPSHATTAGFVQVDGERLEIDGVPWKAIGVNFWDMDAGRVLAGEVTGCWYQHADLDTYFDESFARIKANTHATAVRTFGFRMMYTAGGHDWSTTDKLIHYARKHDLRLIPVFGDQYGTCGSPAKDPWWYRTGYRTLIEEPWGIDYRSYVVEAVRRYRNEPAIAFWQLMNEATAGSDTDALASFSREMATAIRSDAGDGVHPINLGTAGGSTVGNELPAYTDLMACGASTGGCNDLAEAHVFNASDPLPGRPLPASIEAAVVLRAPGGDTYSGPVVRPTIDGWTRLQVNAPAGTWADWSLALSVPQSGAWSAYVDDVLVQTASGPELYTFEAGTGGFTSNDAALSASDRAARGGLASLRAAIPARASAGLVRLDAPDPSSIVSVEAWVRFDFRAPRANSGASLAADLHAASVISGAPFVLGEAGWQAAVPGLAKCASYRTVAQRATSLDGMLGMQLDPLYGSDGALVWDWKDPTIQATAPDGTPIGDPAIDCWTVTPGDPAETVLRAHADLVPPVAKLTAPPPLADFAHRIFVYQGPAATVGRGLPIRMVLRLTHGGDAVPGAIIRPGDGCAGVGVTDALGLADFTCQVTADAGPATLTFAAEAPACACSIEPLAFAVTVKRALELDVSADVAESGDDMPVTIRVRDPYGGSVEGARWSIPECGVEGVVEADVDEAELHATCPAAVDWLGSTLLHLRMHGDQTTLEREVGFVGLRFERIFVDARARDCIGLAPTIGRAGATKRTGKCTGRGMGSYEHWFLHEMGAVERDSSFYPAGPLLVASIDAREGRRIDGTFRWDGPRTFSATLVRPDGVHALAAT